MTTEQQREILEAAANACGLKLSNRLVGGGIMVCTKEHPWPRKFDPINNSADTASMCAKLEIETVWGPAGVFCIDGQLICADEKHDGTDAGKEAAWRLAATRMAAKVGGYTDDI